MQRKREIAIPLSRLRGIWIGCVGLDAGREAPLLAFDLVKIWNPRVLEGVRRMVATNDVRAFTSESMEALLEQMYESYDRLHADCDLIIQHGGFSMMQRSTGTARNVPVVLATLYATDSGTQDVIAGAGLDLTLVPQEDKRGLSARVEALMSTIPEEQQAKLSSVIDRMDSLSITNAHAAEQELDAHNASRRTVWGDKAAVIPISHGTADDVLVDVFACLAQDFLLRDANNLSVEEIRDFGETQFSAQLASLDPGSRAKVERKIAAHERQGTDGAGFPNIRKIVITVYFPGAFGKHEILRTADDVYAAMPCSIYEPAAAPSYSERQVARPSSGVVAERTKRIRRKALYGCLAVFVLLVVVNVILTAVIGLRGAQRKEAVTATARVYPARVGDEQATLSVARVPQGFFQAAGVFPVIGRIFLPSDHAAWSTPTTVITNALWENRFSRAPDVVGQRISVDGRPTTIIGVAPSDFQLPRGVALWLPDSTNR